MSNLRILEPKGLEPHGNVVELCEALLEAAKAGTINAVAVAFEFPEGGSDFKVCHGQHSRPMILLGQVAVMQSQIALRNGPTE